MSSRGFRFGFGGDFGPGTANGGGFGGFAPGPSGGGGGFSFPNPCDLIPGLCDIPGGLPGRNPTGGAPGFQPNTPAEDIFCILFPALCGLPGGPELPGVPENGGCGRTINVTRHVGGFPPVTGGDGKPCCPKNHKLGFNKDGSLCCKRIRRMNPMNPQANRRATRRLTSFVKASDRARSSLAKLAPRRSSRRAPSSKKCCT